MAQNTAKKSMNTSKVMFNGMSETKKPIPKVNSETELEKENTLTEEIEDTENEAFEEEEPLSKPKIVLVKKETETKSSHTFYFDDSLFDRLTKLAKKHGMSVSEALTEILKQVL